MQKIIISLLLLIVTITNAQVNPLKAPDSYAQKQWVDSIMKKMTLDDKIGQLFMIATYSNKGEKHKAQISRMIQKYKVGNLIFMKGTPKKQVQLNNYYQSKAETPLLIGFDGEWGLDMRLKNTYRFPWNMTLGAIRNNQLIEEFGMRLGKHCKRMGIHVNFAPVVDINTNPDNPIIGNRSFGESKKNVTKKALAFIKGVQSVGVLANAKHFPGHGDTSQDSHKTLPSIRFSEKRIKSVELYPYKKIFKQGLASVMVAHLNIPSLEKTRNLPSSLSKSIVTNLLKEELGFKGLVFTDGMNMAGASNYGTAAQVNLKAFLAGNDILLIPVGIPSTIQLFKKSLKNGTLTKERLDYSVRKILQAKYLVGLNNYKPTSEENLLQDLNTKKDELLHRKLVKNSLTLLQNDSRLLPIRDLEEKKIAYVKLGESSSSKFIEMLKNYTKVDVVKSRNINALKKYNLVIIGFHKSNKTPWKSYKFSQKDLQWLSKVAKNKKVILDVFASPYSLLQIKSFNNIESILVSYQNSELAQELSAQAIFGAFSVNGKLPVSIKKEFPLGRGMMTSVLNRLQYTIPEEVGMSSSKLKKIDTLAKMVLDKKMAPGLQILVARHGKVVYNRAFGYHTISKKRKVKKSDLYDLASLTKILATLPMVMKADEEGVVSLNSTIGKLLPAYSGTNKDTLNLKEVLSHHSRLAAWIPFYKKTQGKGINFEEHYRRVKTSKYSIQVANKLYLNNAWKDSIATMIKNEKQRPVAQYKYSDIGYYILKDILEDKYNERLDKLVDNQFYKSIGMNRATYLPLKKYKKSEIVPSEKDTYFRKQVLHGHVHDMGAAMQGGVGGHAGLFSNANDVAKLMQMYLNGGNYGGVQHLDSQTISKYNTRYYKEVKNRRGLGFDKPLLNRKKSTTSERSFGHSGFTGTYTWVDPKSGTLYVFLSNRTYPNMNNKRLANSNIRKIILRQVQKSIIE